MRDLRSNDEYTAGVLAGYGIERERPDPSEYMDPPDVCIYCGVDEEEADFYDGLVCSECQEARDTFLDSLPEAHGV